MPLAETVVVISKVCSPAGLCISIDDVVSVGGSCLTLLRTIAERNGVTADS